MIFSIRSWPVSRRRRLPAPEQTLQSAVSQIEISHSIWIAAFDDANEKASNSKVASAEDPLEIIVVVESTAQALSISSYTRDGSS